MSRLPAADILAETQRNVDSDTGAAKAIRAEMEAMEVMASFYERRAKQGKRAIDEAGAIPGLQSHNTDIHDPAVAA